MFAVLALCLSPAVFSGCGGGDTKVAFFVYDGSDTFISEMMDYMITEIPAGITPVIRNAGNSQAVQNQQIVELIEEGGYALFVINAVDRLACSSIVEKCSGEGIDVVFFNREPLEDALTNDNVFYVGADADKLGEKQADMVAEIFTDGFAGSEYDRNGDGVVQLVILKGEQGHQDAEKRTENCVSRLKVLGFEVEVLAIESANWNRQEGYHAMEQLYARYSGDIELVFSNNDDMALGAIDYLTAAGVFCARGGGYDQPFLIVGVDGTAVGLEAIERGLLYGTVNNDSVKQSEAILELVALLISGNSLDDCGFTVINKHYIYIDGDIITLENVDNYTKR